MPGLANIQSSIGSTPVVVVSKSYCPYCRRAKSILDSYGIDQSKIQIFEIENDPEMRQIQAYMGQITGSTTVPRVFVSGQFVGGADDVQRLHQSGKLNQILQQAGAI